MSQSDPEPHPPAAEPIARTATVRRPLLLALAVAGLAVALLALAAGLFELGARRQAAPVVIAVDKADLEEALYEAPWVSSGGGMGDEGLGPLAEGDAPVLWVVTAPDCAPCRRFEVTVLPRLLDAGVEARVILVAPRASGKEGKAAQEVAVLTKARDWTGLQLWLQGKGEPYMAPLEPAEAEGMLEWGRQSQERIADVLKRNDLALKAPALFWRNGPEWRASIGADAHALSQIEHELAPGA